MGVAGWPVGAVQAPGDHPARLDHLVRADGGAPPRDIDRAFPRRGRRGRPDGPLQRHHPPGPPDLRRSSIVVAAGDPRPPPAGPHVPRDRPAGTGRRGRRVLLRPDRVVRVRGLQHASDGDLRGRSRRVVLRPVGLEPHGQTIGAEVRQAWAGDHPDRWPRPPHPRRARASRLGQHDRRLDSRWKPSALPVGGDASVDDLGEPGRHPPRHERRHSGIPLVRARPQAPHGLEQSQGRGRDRPTPLQRGGAAVEQRGRASAT